MSNCVPLLKESALSGEDLRSLEKEIEAGLSRRLASHESFSRKEIEDVRSRKFRLLPPGWAITEKEEQALRALALHYRVGLRPPHAIRSHRKLVGPIIVAGKKLLFRVLDAFLRDAFQQVEDFQRIAIRSQAHQMVEIKRLSKIVEDLSAGGRQ